MGLIWTGREPGYWCSVSKRWLSSWEKHLVWSDSFLMDDEANAQGNICESMTKVENKSRAINSSCMKESRGPRGQGSWVNLYASARRLLAKMGEWRMTTSMGNSCLVEILCIEIRRMCWKVVLLYISEGTDSNKLEIELHSSLESLSVEVLHPKGNFKVGRYYCPPDQNPENKLEREKEIRERLEQRLLH